MKIELSTLPLSTNTMYFYVGGRRVLKARARELKEQMADEAMSQYRKPPVEHAIRVQIALRWPTRANHDIDNIKMLLDALTGVLWVDDSQIVELHLTKEYNKAHPGVSLEVQSA